MAKYKLYLLYRYRWHTRIFPFTEKSYLHRTQWRYYFYLSRVRILVSPWLLTWLALYSQESFPLRRAAGSFEISFTKSCLLFRNFISIYKINGTLHGRLVIRPLSSRAESIFNSYIHYFILSCFIFMVYYRKDSRPRRIFTSL